jgi:two-component system, cell cycle sensor histidine kinase and response regulator CckA
MTKTPTAFPHFEGPDFRGRVVKGLEGHGPALVILLVPAAAIIAFLRGPGLPPGLTFACLLAVGFAAWVRTRLTADRQRAEEVLQSGNADLETRVKEITAELRTTLDTIADAVFATDTQGHITWLNPAAQALTGWTPQGAMGRPLADVLVLVNEETGVLVENPVARVLRSRAPLGTASHALLLSGDGREIPISYSAAPIRTRGHAVSGVVLAFRDITGTKRLEEQLRQAQKMEAIGRFVGSVAHDFNNLLTVIAGYAEMARFELPEDSPPDSLLVEAVTEISAASRRAGELTGNLLAFSRRQRLRFSMLGLNHVVRDMEKMLRRLLGEDITFSSALSSALWEVWADRNQIEQVIMNLAANARDAMPRGGTLTLETTNIRLEKHGVRKHPGMQPGEYVLLAVSDTGIGMDAKTQAQIFEPFFTTKGTGQGTGLGLATVYRIVKQTGGWISVDSEPGRGATFQVYLPRFSAALPPIERPEDAPRASRSAGHETILLVEDEESLRTLTGKMLARNGFRILAARNGEEAFTICTRENGQIDIILSDMVMPQMSGRQLAEQIRRRYPQVKFVFMSGYSEHAVVKQLMRDSGAPFLSKPFTADGLLAKLHEVLGRDSAASRSAATTCYTEVASPIYYS